jgi:hypothetical protein
MKLDRTRLDQSSIKEGEIVDTKLFAVALLVFTIFAACTAQQAAQQTQTSQPVIKFAASSLADCQKLPDYQDKGTCAVEFGKKVNNLKACNVTTPDLASYKINCMIGVAAEQNNPQFCENMPVQSLDLETQCYEIVARETGNTAICDKLQADRRESCVADIVYRTKNVELCKSAKDQNSCWLSFAVAVQDAKLCDKSFSAESAAFYTYQCYGAVAREKKDVSICDSIADVFSSSNDGKYYCYEQVARATQNPDVCNRIPRNIAASRYDDCLSHVAIEKSDDALCEQISDSSYRVSCFRDVAFMQQNVALCDKTDYDKESCRSSIAGLTGNLTLCNQIQPRYRDDCLASISIQRGDTAICEQVLDQYSKSRCTEQIKLMQEILAI